MRHLFLILTVVVFNFFTFAYGEDTTVKNLSTNTIQNEQVQNIQNTSTSVISNDEYLSEELKTSIHNNRKNEPSYIHAVLSLIAVLGLIYLVSFLYQKLTSFNIKLNGNKGEENKKNKFKIISTTPLGQGKFLYVVEINNKFLALGATQDNISFLREFSQDEIDGD